MIVTELGVVEYPQAMTVDGRGNLYFNDSETGLWKLDPTDTSKSPKYLYYGSAEFGGIVWDGNNTLYICESGSDHGYRLCEYRIDTRKAKRHKIEQIQLPVGIAIDKHGILYVRDDVNQVHKLNPRTMQVESIAETVWNTHNHKTDHKNLTEDGEVKQEFNPSGIAVTKDESVYVTDSSQFCIKIIKDGFVSTIAGSPGKRGSRDGTLTEARFWRLLGSEMCVDSDGSLLVADDLRLRKIDIKRNTVSTVFEAENGIQCFTVDKNGIIYAVVDCRHVLKIERTWKWERFLWIAWFKEDSSYCTLAQLPTDILKEIAFHLQSPSKYLTTKGIKRKRCTDFGDGSRKSSNFRY